MYKFWGFFGTIWDLFGSLKYFDHFLHILQPISHPQLFTLFDIFSNIFYLFYIIFWQKNSLFVIGLTFGVDVRNFHFGYIYRMFNFFWRGK